MQNRLLSHFFILTISLVVSLPVFLNAAITSLSRSGGRSVPSRELAANDDWFAEIDDMIEDMVEPQPAVNMQGKGVRVDTEIYQQSTQVARAEAEGVQEGRSIIQDILQSDYWMESDIPSAPANRRRPAPVIKPSPTAVPRESPLQTMPASEEDLIVVREDDLTTENELLRLEQEMLHAETASNDDEGIPDEDDGTAEIDEIITEAAAENGLNEIPSGSLGISIATELSEPEPVAASAEQHDGVMTTKVDVEEIQILSQTGEERDQASAQLEDKLLAELELFGDESDGMIVGGTPATDERGTSAGEDAVRVHTEQDGDQVIASDYDEQFSKPGLNESMAAIEMEMQTRDDAMPSVTDIPDDASDFAQMQKALNQAVQNNDMDEMIRITSQLNAWVAQHAVQTANPKKSDPVVRPVQEQQEKQPAAAVTKTVEVVQETTEEPASPPPRSMFGSIKRFFTGNDAPQNVTVETVVVSTTDAPRARRKMNTMPDWSMGVQNQSVVQTDDARALPEKRYRRIESDDSKKKKAVTVTYHSVKKQMTTQTAEPKRQPVKVSAPSVPPIDPMDFNAPVPW